MTRKTTIVSVTFQPQQIEYLRELCEEGYNKSAVIRKSLELYKLVKQRRQQRKEGGLNE